MDALITVMYVAGLFVAAWFGGYRGYVFKRFQAVIYSLTLTLYCTSWTFFGAIGQVSKDLWSFIPICFGPMVVFVLFWKLLHKLLTIMFFASFIIVSCPTLLIDQTNGSLRVNIQQHDRVSPNTSGYAVFRFTDITQVSASESLFSLLLRR